MGKWITMSSAKIRIAKSIEGSQGILVKRKPLILRKIYAALAYQQFADKDEVSESAYLSDILGHVEGSLDVSKSYSTVSVVKKDTKEPEKKVDFKDLIVPRNLKVRDGKGVERLAETVRVMRLKDLPITNKILRGYGYSATSVGVFMKDYTGV